MQWIEGLIVSDWGLFCRRLLQNQTFTFHFKTLPIRNSYLQPSLANLPPRIRLNLSVLDLLALESWLGECTFNVVSYYSNIRERKIHNYGCLNTVSVHTAALSTYWDCLRKVKDTRNTKSMATHSTHRCCLFVTWLESKWLSEAHSKAVTWYNV